MQLGSPLGSVRPGWLVHGYATHYNQDWVSVAWTDEVFSHHSCWIPTADVRRPAEGEWHGRYVQFG